LHPADIDSIKTHVQVDVTVENQAIVTDDLDVGRLRGVHHAAGLSVSVRQYDQHFDPGADHIFYLLELPIVVTVGVARDHLRAQLLSPCLKGIQVRLPTLSLHRLKGKTYEQFVSVFRLQELGGKDDKEYGRQNRQPASRLRQGISPYYGDDSRGR
jgi:hypothetical protein